MPQLTPIHYDALPLEYKLDEWRTGGNYHVFNAMDEPVRQSVCCIFGLGLSEKPIDVMALQRRFLTDYAANSLVFPIDRQ